MKGAGKSTFIGLFHIVCTDVSLEDPNFTYTSRERTLGIRKAAADLCAGKFPDSTPTKISFKCDVRLKWHGWLHDKIVNLSIIDSSGEECSKVIQDYNQGVFGVRDFNYIGKFTDLHEKLFASKALALVMPATKVTVMGRLIEGDIKSIEDEQLLLEIPDLNLAHLLEAVFEYKETNRDLPSIERIVVLLSKYDQIRDLLGPEMSLETESGLHNFLFNNYKETYNILKSFGLNKVDFIPIWVDLAYRDGRPIPHPEGGDTILVDKKTLRPSFSRQAILRFINVLKNL